MEMGKEKRVKLVVFVPETHAEDVRLALGAAGAGRIGNYTYCSFSSKGIGRYKGGEGSHPAVGQAGHFESVAEERIEMVVERSMLPTVIAAMKESHPYEEVAFDVYALEDF